MTPLLVVGTGRSGTGYMAALLSAAGLPCGHEAMHTDRTALAAEPPPWSSPAESSWLAVPHLAAERARGTAVVLVVREPFAVARSLEALGIMAEPRNTYAEVIASHTPATWAWRLEANRALAHWCAWNAEAAASADLIVCLSQLGPSQLRAIGALVGHPLPGAEQALASVPRDVNNKREAKRSERPEGFAPLLRRQAQHLYRRWCGALPSEQVGVGEPIQPEPESQNNEPGG